MGYQLPNILVVSFTFLYIHLTTFPISVTAMIICYLYFIPLTSFFKISLLFHTELLPKIYVHSNSERKYQCPVEEQVNVPQNVFSVNITRNNVVCLHYFLALLQNLTRKGWRSHVRKQ